MAERPADAPPGGRLAAADAAGVTGDERFGAEYFEITGDGIVVAFAVQDGPSRPVIGSWLHITGDGAVTVYTGKVEVGQNIRTSLAQVVAEELSTPIASVRLVMGDTGLSPYDIGTFSSLTTRTIGTQLRRIAAAAKGLVLGLAAQEELPGRFPVLLDGTLTDHRTGRTATLGELAAGRRIVETVSRTRAVTPFDQWIVAGLPAPKSGAHDHVTGSHRFSTDVVVPGMVYGRVLRPPAFHAALETLDTTAAEALTGVTVVRDGDFVGVTAPDSRTAARAITLVEAAWRTLPQIGRQDLFAHLKRNPLDFPGRDGAFTHHDGSLDEGWAAAATRLRRTYTVDYLAHAPMEPRAAAASWRNGRLEVWTATQRPFAVRAELARVCGVPERDVRVIVPDAGSAFGGKHTGDAAVEAARLARAVRRPVKVVWTRAEEFTWGYLRPAGVIDVGAGARADGTLTAWEFTCHNAGREGLLGPYPAAGRRVEFRPARAPLRQGPYRALAATANHFARETHLDELARTLVIDPLELRRRNLRAPRLLAVLEIAADTFGWDARVPPPDHGFGLAVGQEKGGHLATCAEVAVDPETGHVQVMRVVQAFECGTIVNPDHLRAQVEGAIIQGVGGAMFEAVEFEDGVITNASFSGYRLPRFPDVPRLEVVLVDRRDLPPAGAGESPIVGVAPALGNAIFDATGIRLRALPLAPYGLLDHAETDSWR